jgi:hypothetical protein
METPCIVDDPHGPVLVVHPLYFLGASGLNFVDSGGVYQVSEQLDPYSWDDTLTMRKILQTLGSFAARVIERVRQTAHLDAERAGLGIPDEAKTLPAWANRAMKRAHMRRHRTPRGPGIAGYSGIARRIAAGGKVRGY